MEKETKLVPAADKTLQILEYMAMSAKSTFGITEISDALNLNKGTVYSILHTMIFHHWVQQDRTGKYFLTNKITLLSINTEKNNLMVTEFLTLAREIEKNCGELVNLHYLKGLTHVTLVSKVPSKQHTLRVDLPLGSEIPVFSSSAGKCLICDLDDATIREVYRRCSTMYTHNKIHSEEEFLQHIHRVREKGYATNESEYESGVHSVAAPVRDSAGTIIAAINIVVPESRYNHERKLLLIDLVKKGALQLSLVNGYRDI